MISSTTSISKWGEHGSNLPVHPRLPLLLQESHQGPHPPVQVLMDVNLRLLESRNLVSSFNFQLKKHGFLRVQRLRSRENEFAQDAGLDFSFKTEDP